MILHQADCSMLSIILSLVQPYKIQSLPAVRRNVRHADKIIAFVASVSVRFRSKEWGTRVISRAVKTEKNPFPLSFFAPKPNGNACYATLGSRGYFFLIDTDGSRWSRLNEAQSAEEKKIIIVIMFFSSAVCTSLTRLGREPSVSIRKKISSLTQGIATQANKIANKIYVWFR